MNKHFIIIFILTLFLGFSSFAQEQNEPLFYQKSKKSAKLTNSSNILKTDVVSIIGGELPFIWEHKFSKTFGIELGAGVLLPYYVNTDLIFSDNIDFSNDKSGYSFLANIKAQPFWFSDENFYTIFGVHYRHYSTCSFSSFSIGEGYQWLLFEKLSLDVGLQGGFLAIKSFETETYNDDSGMKFYFGLSLRLGYILN